MCKKKINMIESDYMKKRFFKKKRKNMYRVKNTFKQKDLFLKFVIQFIYNIIDIQLCVRYELLYFRKYSFNKKNI